MNHYIHEDNSTGHKSKGSEIIDWAQVDRDLIAKFWYAEPDKAAQLQGTKEGEPGLSKPFRSSLLSNCKTPTSRILRRRRSRNVSGSPSLVP